MKWKRIFTDKDYDATDLIVFGCLVTYSNYADFPVSTIVIVVTWSLWVGVRGWMERRKA